MKKTQKEGMLEDSKSLSALVHSMYPRMVEKLKGDSAQELNASSHEGFAEREGGFRHETIWQDFQTVSDFYGMLAQVVECFETKTDCDKSEVSVKKTFLSMMLYSVKPLWNGRFQESDIPAKEAPLYFARRAALAAMDSGLLAALTLKPKADDEYEANPLREETTPKPRKSYLAAYAVCGVGDIISSLQRLYNSGGDSLPHITLWEPADRGRGKPPVSFERLFFARITGHDVFETPEGKYGVLLCEVCDELRDIAKMQPRLDYPFNPHITISRPSSGFLFDADAATPLIGHWVSLRVKLSYSE